MEKLGRNNCRIGEELTLCGFAGRKMATRPVVTRPVTLLPIANAPVHRLGETFCRRYNNPEHKQNIRDEQGQSYLFVGTNPSGWRTSRLIPPW